MDKLQIYSFINFSGMMTPPFKNLPYTLSLLAVLLMLYVFQKFAMELA